jgi:cytochrome c oxidase subunit 2
MSTSGFFIVAILALGFLIVFQIAKASEYVSVLRGEKKSLEQNNRVNGFLLISFLVLGIVGIWWCNDLFYDRTLFPHPAASEHGEKIDIMMWITLAVTGFVFFITQIALFWFSFKYQYRSNKVAYYYPHNNKLEFIWTTVPAIFLCTLVGFGLYYWFQITGEAPENSLKVEITGKQFGWIYRYAGKDNMFGKKSFRLIDEAKGNLLGLTWTDTTIDRRDDENKVVGSEKITADRACFDDIVTQEALYVVKDQPVKLIINSRDVIHDVGLAHFRLKLDAVPGTPTTMWFTPKYTTDEMRKITNNPNFEYEISCDQMCGNGHYTMRGVIKVVTTPEFMLWRAKQKPAHASAFATEQSGPPAQPKADSAKTTAAPLQSKPVIAAKN